MISEGKYPENICEELLTYCLAPVCQMGGLGGDNMTIIIICFLHGKPWQHLVDKCKRIHAEKKSSSKLCEASFNTFDRFAAEGPFSEVSVLKTVDELQNANETSSSSHTSSPSSSSPISTEEKFNSLLNDATGSTEVTTTVTKSNDTDTKETFNEISNTNDEIKSKVEVEVAPNTESTKVEKNENENENANVNVNVTSEEPSVDSVSNNG